MGCREVLVGDGINSRKWDCFLGDWKETGTVSTEQEARRTDANPCEQAQVGDKKTSWPRGWELAACRKHFLLQAAAVFFHCRRAAPVQCTQLTAHGQDLAGITCTFNNSWVCTKRNNPFMITSLCISQSRQSHSQRTSICCSSVFHCIYMDSFYWLEYTIDFYFVRNYFYSSVI